MNKILNKFLLAEDKFMLPLHLRQPIFTSRACGPFTKHREKIQKVTHSNLKLLHRNKLDKACFGHDAAYSDSKDLANETILGNILSL